MLKHFFNFLAKIVSVFVFCLGVWVLLYKYDHFAYSDWDLAFFTQAFWNLVHGSQYSSLVGINYFGDHSYYFTFFLLPVFAIFPHPVTLLVLKTLAFGVSGYLLYRVLRPSVGEWQAFTWMFLYFIFPPNVFALLYEFNIEAFAPVFLLLAYDYFQREEYVPFILSSLCLCLIKENLFLIVFMFGLYALITKRRDPVRWVFVPMAVSLVGFLVCVFWLIPMVRDLPQHAFWVRYASLMGHPAEFLSRTMSANKDFILNLFGPLLWPALLAPQSLVFVVPVFLQHLLSDKATEQSIYFHYGLTLTPFVFLAASAGMTKIGRSLDGPKMILLWAVLVLFVVGHVYRFVPDFKSFILRHNDASSEVRWALARKIPPDASVVATFEFLAPLSTRKSLYSFHKLYDDFYQDPARIKRSELFNNGVFLLPEDVDWALIDLDDYVLKMLIRNDSSGNVEKRVSDFIQTWRLVERQGPILLLRKNIRNP